MSLTGTLDIALTVAEHRVTDVRFSGLRPLPLGALLGGKPAADAPVVIGALFALCGYAQRACASAAVQAAAGRKADPAEEARGSQLIIAEALREHGIRIAVAWPGLLGEAPDMETATLLHRGVRDLAARHQDAIATLAQSIRRLVFGAPSPVVEFADAQAYSDWARGQGTPSARLAARLLGDPPGEANPAEPGTPLGRHAGHPVVAAVLNGHGELAARVAARLVEVLALCRRLDGGENGAVVASGADRDGGWARTEVARGTLDHRVRVSDGRIVDYRIDAPTTANFAPSGPAEAAFRRLAGTPDEIAWRARLTALELDPCVEFTLQVS